jgi:hypothetical protein
MEIDGRRDFSDSTKKIFRETVTPFKLMSAIPGKISCSLLLGFPCDESQFKALEVFYKNSH